jgi:hypothetical protein
MKKIILAVLIALTPLVSRADTIQFAWDAVTQGIDGQPVVGLLGYKLYISNTAGTYTTPRITATGTTTSITENAVGTYYAVVRAYNEVGESGNSNEISFTIKAKVPGAPTQFKRLP